MEQYDPNYNMHASNAQTELKHLRLISGSLVVLASTAVIGCATMMYTFMTGPSLEDIFGQAGVPTSKVKQEVHQQVVQLSKESEALRQCMNDAMDIYRIEDVISGKITDEFRNQKLDELCGDVVKKK